MSTFEEQLAPVIAEATDLRYGFVVPDPHAAPQEWLDALLDARRRQDRVETLLGQCLRAKYRLKRTKDLAEAEAKHAYDVAQTDAGRSPVRLEFVSAKEKDSSASLASFEERRAARQATLSLSYVEEAYEFVAALRWGLEGVRKDIHAALKAVSWEQSMER